MGMGACLSDTVPDADRSPYLQVENIDPQWLAAVQAKRTHDADESIGERASKRRRKDSAVG
jgi:hypothetical protein